MLQERTAPLGTFVRLAAAAVAWAATAAAQEPTFDQDVAIQTRGPVHEAFADLATFDPAPDAETAREPPAAVEEWPPEERPAGENAQWIAGYWAWDDEPGAYLWVSGVWRVAPPAHRWIAGYWGRGLVGWRWVRGFWFKDDVGATGEVTYYAAPPASLESGPSSPRPDSSYDWAPGSWAWRDSRYVWRPGDWFVGDPDWIWVAAQYRWTPAGVVFVESHWDYPLERRGVLYAPVVFLHPAPVYRYRPIVAVDLGLLSVHLFSRPSRHHYYFGDWYAADDWNRGIYPTFAFNMSVYGYDPVYQHRRWTHRRNERAFEDSVREDFHRYRDGERARPPRSFAAQEAEERRPGGRRADDVVMVRRAQDLPARGGAKTRFEPVSAPERRPDAVAARRLADKEDAVGRASTERVVAERRAAGGVRGATPEKAALRASPRAIDRAPEGAAPKARPPVPVHRAERERTPTRAKKAAPAPEPSKRRMDQPDAPTRRIPPPKAEAPVRKVADPPRRPEPKLPPRKPPQEGDRRDAPKESKESKETKEPKSDGNKNQPGRPRGRRLDADG